MDKSPNWAESQYLGVYHRFCVVYTNMIGWTWYTTWNNWLTLFKRVSTHRVIGIPHVRWFVLSYVCPSLPLILYTIPIPTIPKQTQHSNYKLLFFSSDYVYTFILYIWKDSLSKLFWFGCRGCDRDKGELLKLLTGALVIFTRQSGHCLVTLPSRVNINIVAIATTRQT